MQDLAILLEELTLNNVLGLDLGTKNTVICDPANGILYDEPTVIAHDKRSGKTVAIGNEVADVVGRVPGYVVIERPISGGRIVDTRLLDSYLQALLKVIPIKKFGKPKLVVASPSSSTLIERKSMVSALHRLGISDVEQVDSVLASAIGLGTDVSQPNGSMVVNLGAGLSLSGIIAFGEIVVDAFAFCGGESLNEAIVNLLKYRWNVSIDDSTSEELKLALAGVSVEPPRYASSFIGRDLMLGSTVNVEIDEGSVREVIADPVKRIIQMVLENLSKCPAELAQDLVFEGLILCGGTSQLRGLANVIADSTNIPVRLVDEPRHVLAKGLASYGVNRSKKVASRQSR